MTKYLLTLAIIIAAGYAYFNASPVGSFSQEPMPEALLEDIGEMQEEWKPLKVSGDAIPWELFATTKEDESCVVGDEGYDICLVKPEYSDAVKKLNGIEVTLMGYMFPLEQSESQKNFLVGPYPLSCPFHYHVGPTQMVEVFADEHIEFSYEPITLKGVLELKFNEETGVFYYLRRGSKV